MTTAQVLTALIRVPIGQIEPGPNARGDVGDIAELAISIRAIGMQKPLLVHDIGGGRYRILDGHRRYAAAQLLELPYVDALLRRAGTDAQRLQQQVAIHTQAKPFDPIAEARAMSELMFAHKLTREQIAEAAGRTPGWVRDRLGLLALKPDEQRDVAAGRMSLSEARATLAHRREVAEGRYRQRWPGRRPGAQDRKPVGETALPSEQPAAGRHCATCRCGAPS